MAAVEMLGNQNRLEIMACTVSAQVLAKVVAGEVDGAVLRLRTACMDRLQRHYDLLLALPRTD